MHYRLCRLNIKGLRDNISLTIIITCAKIKKINKEVDILEISSPIEKNKQERDAILSNILKN